MGISARRGRGRERWSSECRGIPLMWWMRWTRLYAAVAIACVFGVSAMSEDGPDAHFSADELMLGDSAAPEHDPVKTALQKKMQAVGELHEEAKDLLGGDLSSARGRHRLLSSSWRTTMARKP